MLGSHVRAFLVAMGVHTGVGWDEVEERWLGTRWERPAPLYSSYATRLGGYRSVLACLPLRAVNQRLLDRVNTPTAVGGP